MLASIIVFLVVNAFYLGLAGFAVYRVAQHLRGNDEAARMVLQHVLVPLFAGRKAEPEVVPDVDVVPVEKEVF
jgi:hypothetical protein